MEEKDHKYAIENKHWGNWIPGENPKTSKNNCHQKVHEYQINKIYKAADKKSMVMDYVWNKTRETISKKPTYINNMTRRECASIFAVRFRMPNVKGNYKNKYTELTCRWCKNNVETQEHILKQCAEFTHITKNTTYEVYFDDNEKKSKTWQKKQLKPYIRW